MSTHQNSFRKLTQNFSAKDQSKQSHAKAQSPKPSLLTRREFCLTLALCAFVDGSPDAQGQALGPLYQAAPHPDASPRHRPHQGLDSVRRWNQIAIDASGLDHTPPAPGENRAFREQLGPGRASRAMAIVHIAMFDTINAVVGEYQSYTGVRARNGALSMQAAICQAAHDTLA